MFILRSFRGVVTITLSLWLGGFSLVQAQALQPPEAVQNVEAQAQNASVRLTWEESIDDGIISHYKVHYGAVSVTEPGDAYDQEVSTPDSDTTFVVGNLINNNRYYFAVTAVDDQGLESENYSVEVSATPGVIEGNGDPFLVSAEHTSPNTVVITMSEAVQVNGDLEAFELVQASTGEPVNVVRISANSERVNLVVLTDALTAGETYQVTATTGVRDFDNNPVSSGVVDSQQFVAQANFAPVLPPVVEPSETTDTPEEPETPEEEALLEEPLIEPVDNADNLFSGDNNGAINTADFLENLLAEENPINNLPGSDPFASEPESEAALSAATDTVPPQDARNIMADTSNLDSGQVRLSWEAALDVDGDIKDQVLYTRVGIGAWDTGLSLGATTSQIALEVEPNQNYQVRLVTLDEAGNESFGAAFEFSTHLTQSGAGHNMAVVLTVIAVLGTLFLFAGRRA